MDELLVGLGEDDDTGGVGVDPTELLLDVVGRRRAVVVVTGLAVVVEVVVAVVVEDCAAEDAGLVSDVGSLIVFTRIGPESAGECCDWSPPPLASAATVANTVDTTIPATARTA